MMPEPPSDLDRLADRIGGWMLVATGTAGVILSLLFAGPSTGPEPFFGLLISLAAALTGSLVGRGKRG